MSHKHLVEGPRHALIHAMPLIVIGLLNQEGIAGVVPPTGPAEASIRS